VGDSISYQLLVMTHTEYMFLYCVGDLCNHCFSLSSSNNLCFYDLWNCISGPEVNAGRIVANRWTNL